MVARFLGCLLFVRFDPIEYVFLSVDGREQQFEQQFIVDILMGVFVS